MEPTGTPLSADAMFTPASKMLDYYVKNCYSEVPKLIASSKYRTTFLQVENKVKTSFLEEIHRMEKNKKIFNLQINYLTPK